MKAKSQKLNQISVSAKISEKLRGCESSKGFQKEYHVLHLKLLSQKEMTGRRGEFIAACSIKTAKKNYM
jgi:hypothetical protein